MADPALWPLDDHTRAKHRVLRAYLNAWLPVMGQQAQKVIRLTDDPPRLLLVDGFAGPGRYETGEEGSPLIMLKTLLEHDAFGRMGDVEFNYLFIEHDARRVAHLETELENLELPANVQYELVAGTRYIATRTAQGQEVLFTPDPDAVDTSPLLDHLREKFGNEWFTIEEADESVLETVFRVAHLRRKTLAPAEKEGKIEVDRSGGQRQFATGVRIRFVG